MMRLEMNMCQRQELLTEMRLKSDLFENILVRTENLLKQRRYQNVLKLLNRICEKRQAKGAEYNSIIDFLVGLCSPGWDAVIQEYYRTNRRGQNNQLVKYVSWDVIQEMDLGVCGLLVALKGLYKVYEESGWSEGRDSPEFDQMTEQAIQWFVAPRFPEAIPYDKALERAA